MEMNQEIITLDGPTSSGKNSVGYLLAQKLGFRYIDTGMIYRAGSFKMIKENVSPDDLERILHIYKNLDIKFEANGEWKMILEGEDVTHKLHTTEISNLVSIVAAKPEVREVTRDIQRNLAKEGKVVMGGRDIGTEIFPEAKYKFWLTASVEERAKRRYLQLQREDPVTSFEQVLSDMKERDRRDSEREASPMRTPQGAIVIDNTKLTIEQTVEDMLKKIATPLRGSQ